MGNKVIIEEKEKGRQTNKRDILVGPTKNNEEID